MEAAETSGESLVLEGTGGEGLDGVSTSVGCCSIVACLALLSAIVASCRERPNKMNEMWKERKVCWNANALELAKRVLFGRRYCP